MILCVCGGRDFEDRAFVFATLDRIHKKRPITTLVHGAAPGADWFAQMWARARAVRYVGCPADWDRLGRGAGPVRNAYMAAQEGIEGLLAFPGGTGTADMVRRAREAGIKVMEVRP